jgi:hypothetical protein
MASLRSIPMTNLLFDAGQKAGQIISATFCGSSACRAAFNAPLPCRRAARQRYECRTGLRTVFYIVYNIQNCIQNAERWPTEALHSTLYTICKTVYKTRRNNGFVFYIVNNTQTANRNTSTNRLGLHGGNFACLFDTLTKMTIDSNAVPKLVILGEMRALLAKHPPHIVQCIDDVIATCIPVRNGNTH